MSSPRRDYVPQNAMQFMAFLTNLIEYAGTRITGTTPQWPNIPATRLAELTGAAGIFSETLMTAQSTPTPANILARTEAQAEATRLLRAFVNQFLRFPPVTNVDRVEMGIPNHDTIHTDHKVVTETVDFVIRLRNIRELAIDFWQSGANHRAKPNGYDGAVLIWGVLDTPPQRPEDFVHHTMASRTPFILHFDDSERGKTVWVALSWQNERGITGAWSEYKSAVIP